MDQHASPESADQLLGKAGRAFVEPKAATPPRSTVRSRERIFFTEMAVALLLTVFAGFARTYYLKGLVGGPPLSPLLHLHGVVFSAWLVLLAVQTTLVAANRTNTHRRLGLAGAALAVLMVLLGTGTALIRAHQGAAPPGFGQPLAFLVIPLGDMVVFSSMAGAGFYFKRRLDTHKRLMLLATIAILPAATARLPISFMQTAGPLGFYGLADLFIVPIIFLDILTTGRIHRTTLIGGLAVVASQPVRLFIGSTPAWQSFAAVLTDWAGSLAGVTGIR